MESGLSPEQWERVQELFAAALAREPRERSAFLAQACGSDSAVRAEVESLLESDDRIPDEFMVPEEAGRMSSRSSPPESPAFPAGMAIGEYRVQSVIAAGGMGTVYLAQQERPQREVALKVMKGGIASRSAMRRFEYESQILARLRHPNIAHVYEAGVHEGRVPYFVMEYIPEARPITKYAQQQGLGTRERLELFLKICDAVHHGHQRGIIHRDLKPANILVDAAGEPKVIDFGVARATDSDMAVTTLRTDIGQLVGTLQYMSPEQCAADPHNLDTRSDVYSLGVVLYELLCGRVPYDVSHVPIFEATRVIREEMPARISAIDRTLRGDVETIVLKALEKDRERRYQSAADLARDIAHYLNREPIEAKPPTAWTLAVRCIGRHPLPTAVGLSLLLAAIIFPAITLYMALPVYFRFKDYPDNVVLSTDRSKVRLLSVGGQELYVWDGKKPGAFRFAKIVERPRGLGGRMILIGFDEDYPKEELAGSMCAFDIKTPEGPFIWQRRIARDEVPPLIRDLKGDGRDDFVFSTLWLHDVFLERPGNEIVVACSSIYSQRLVRVYDLAGEKLYEFWHDGDLSDCAWLREAGLLVFAGWHWAYADDLGGGHGAMHPSVVFAVRPILGKNEIRFVDSIRENVPLVAAWYKFLSAPGIHKHQRHLTFFEPPSSEDDGLMVRMACEMMIDDSRSAGIHWYLNATGELMPGTVVPMDDYVLKEEWLPPPEEFRLVDLGDIRGELNPVAARLRWPEEYRSLDPLPPLWADEPDMRGDTP